MRTVPNLLLLTLLAGCPGTEPTEPTEACTTVTDVCQGQQRVQVDCDGQTLQPLDRCGQDEICVDSDENGPVPAYCEEVVEPPCDDVTACEGNRPVTRTCDGLLVENHPSCGLDATCTDTDENGDPIPATCVPNAPCDDVTTCEGNRPVTRTCDGVLVENLPSCGLDATCTDTDENGDPITPYCLPDPVCDDVTTCEGNRPVVRTCDGILVEYLPDCATNEVCRDEDDAGNAIPGECYAPCGDPQDHLVCDPNDLADVHYADACDNITGIAEDCHENATCDDVGGAPVCVCTTEVTPTCSFDSAGGDGLYDLTSIVDTSSCEADATIETCDFGTKCYQETGFFGDQPVCARSVTTEAAASPYYDNSCSFADWVRHPTDLDIDCRCRVTGDGGSGGGYVDPTTQANPGNAIINCRPLGELVGQAWPLAYGSGPSFMAYHTNAGTGGDFFGGDFDPVTRELFTVVRWGNASYSRTGSVLAFQVDSGARRVISGLYPDSNLGIVTYGSGYDTPRALGQAGADQPLTGASALKMGPDGMLYVWGGGLGETPNKQRFIVRVDPTTGVRTKVWQSQHDGSAGQGDTGDLTATYGQCVRHGDTGTPNSVAFTPNAFAIDDAGNFYSTFHGVREGDGLVRISADGTTCEFLSRFGAGGSTGTPPADIGGGFTPQTGALEGLMLKDGKAWTVTLSGALITMDLTTGDRVAVGPVPSGGYTGIGYQNIFWDDTRNVVWAVGNHAPYTGSVIDPLTGQRESVFGDSTDYPNPILQSDYGVARSVTNSMLGNGNGVFHGSFTLDPLDDDIVWFIIQGGGLAKMELSTFNNYVHSM
ncbi:MAG: hypothetical protein H6734_15100 [Alphaproteobacteria bacterium]|nr:hypothetical protein [Alphaproteobacteria bacterium]